MGPRQIVNGLAMLAAAGCGPRIDTEEAGKGRSLAAGDEAPEFTLESSDGETFVLGALRGRIVVLYFYPKDETPGCTKEACSFRDSMEAFGEMNVAVLGVSLDSKESHDKFKKAHKLNFPLLSDPDGRVTTAYGAWKQGSKRGGALAVDRSTFAIDREGKIARIWRGVDVIGHSDEVLAFVRTLP